MLVEVMEEEWLYSEALRPSEARTLRVGDAVLPEFGLGKLTVRHKGMVREIPLQVQFVEFLREWISEAGLREENLLFGPLSAPVCRRVWEQAQEAVLPRDEPYSGRRGEPAFIQWLRMGVSPFVVAELAGVNPSRLALRYPHCFRAEKAEIDWDHLAEAMALPVSLRP